MDLDQEQRGPLSSYQPPPCRCSARHPQLNTTITGRCCGCASCLCDKDEHGGGSQGSSGHTQPSSGADDLLERFGGIKITVDCCECCETSVGRVGIVERVVDVEPGPGTSTSSVHPARCGPYEQTPSGHFVVSGDGRMSSPDGSVIYRVSFDLMYRTRTPSMATMPPSVTRPHSPFSLTVLNGAESAASLFCAHTDCWTDEAPSREFRNGGPDPRGAFMLNRQLPSMPANFEDLFDTTGAHPYYPPHIDMPDA